MIKLKSILLSLFCAVALASCCSKGNESAGKRIAALDEGEWKVSEWISAANAPVVTGKVEETVNNLAADGASWFVSELTNDKKVVSAKWMTAGLGVYELYVNGKRIGEEFLKPGFTHYAKTKLSFTYDVTDAFNLASGASNQLAAQVTPGWWADKIISPSGKEGMIGGKPAFRAVLELTYSDGSRLLYGTDCQNWKAGIAGPVKHAAIYDGEFYDAREIPGYACPEKLLEPELNTAFDGEIIPSEGAEIYLRKDLTLKPVEAYVWKDVEGVTDSTYGKVLISRRYRDGEPMLLHEGETLVIDFGQNASAVPAFVFNAAEGTKLSCLPSEILNDGNGAQSRGMDGPEGSCHRTNLRIHENAVRLDYIFAASDKPVEYFPRCTFYGYRYLSITATGDVSIKSVVSIPVTSITEEMEIGHIETDNELVNKLISNTIWGMRSNYLSVPTDCPQRNERLGWMADTQVFTETGAFFANTNSFFHKWLRDIRDTQIESGGYPGVAPISAYARRSISRLGWADAGIIVPWTVWRQFGDLSLLEEHWESMEKYMDHINEAKYDHETLKEENRNYQWGDWLSYEPLESSGNSAFYHDPKTNKRKPLPETLDYWNYLSASYWAMDAAMMRDMATALGRDVRKYVAMEEVAKNYLREQFFTPEGRFKTEILNTMQTPALFALKNNLFTGEAREKMIAALRENFAVHGGCLQTGFLGTSILMETLSENGMFDIAAGLLLQRKNPSWLYSVDNGATTIWERWNSYTIEHGMGPKGMNSFNHYAYGCVCAWIWKYLAGISADTSAPGFRHFILAPHRIDGINHLKASYKSVAGEIKSEWSVNGDKCSWSFTIPDGTSATVSVPGKDPEEYQPGSYKLEI
ncbi:MAG: family 78 glycoside hydrolase catalytic domain [Bacteroidales bacterium]|nr:family 78 glycoside hydrolase catalytic domain [Bacteroidales bacterium]